MQRIFRIILFVLIAVHANASSPELQTGAMAGNELSGLSGTEKIEKLHELADDLKERNDTLALDYAAQALEIARARGDDQLTLSCLNTFADLSTHFHNYGKSLELLRQAMQLHNRVEDPAETIRTYEFLGNTQTYAADYTSAEENYSKGLAYLKDLKEPREEDEARLKHLLGVVYRYKGDYDKALEYYYDALDFFESVADSSQIYEVRESIGVVSFLRGEMDKALAMFESTMDYFQRQKDTSSLGFSYTLLGLAHFRMKDYDKSIEFAEKSVEIRKSRNDIRGLGESYNNLALGYMGKQDWEKALEYLKASEQSLIKGNDLREIPVILGNIGDCYRYLGDPIEAIRQYRKGLEFGNESGVKHSLYNLYRKISSTYAQMGDFANAYENYQRYAGLKDSIYSEEKAKAISELELKYQKEKNEQRIALLERDKEISESRRLALYLGLGLVVMVSLFIIILQITRARKKKQLYEREMQILEAREALTEAELKNTRNELEYNKSRMKVFMENILTKNTLIEELESRLEGLTISDESENLLRQEKLSELLQMKILTDEDWVTFKGHFVQAFPGFLETLQNAHENLTTGETRLFLLVKLGLSSREISNILGVSGDAVKKARYRLRKKLELSEEGSLEEYVSNFT